MRERVIHTRYTASSNDTPVSARARVDRGVALAWQRAGVNAILDHDDTVDHDRGAASARISMRICIGRAVVKISGIEDRHVGAITFAQQTAISELERARARAGHLVHGALEREDAELAHVMADDAGKVP